MIKKTIQINPELFKLSGNKKSKKKKKLRTKLLSSSIKPNKLKKQLIARVKAHQKKKEEELNEKDNKELEKFQDDFNESMNYLNSITKKRKKEKKFKEKKSILNSDNIENNLQDIKSLVKNEISNLIKPEPPYGILKHGKKQLYSKYRKTLKKKHSPYSNPIVIEEKNDEPKNDFSIRQNKLDVLRQKIKKENPIKQTKYKKQKTRRLIKKVTLGKNKNQNTIGILIKNRKTRKKIETELKKLQKSKLSKIKMYLRKHNLIKIGSDAPEHILRNMYENAYLSGDIMNNNSDIILHNYMKETNI